MSSAESFQGIIDIPRGGVAFVDKWASNRDPIDDLARHLYEIECEMHAADMRNADTLRMLEAELDNRGLEIDPDLDDPGPLVPGLVRVDYPELEEGVDVECCDDQD